MKKLLLVALALGMAGWAMPIHGHHLHTVYFVGDGNGTVQTQVRFGDRVFVLWESKWVSK